MTAPDDRERIARYLEAGEKATQDDWRVVRRKLPLTELGRQRGMKEGLIEEVGIETVHDHPQLKAPDPIVTVAHGPYYEPTSHVYIRPANAEFIAAAANARGVIARLVARVEALEAALKRYGEHAETCEVTLCSRLQGHHDEHDDICPCDCGLDALLAPPAAPEGTVRELTIDEVSGVVDDFTDGRTLAEHLADLRDAEGT